MQDLRHALRMMLKSPGFTAVALLALALGIGASSAIFTLVNAVLLRPLPYPDSERLFLVVRQYRQSRNETVSIPKIDYWRKHSQAFESLTAFDVIGAGYNLSSAEGEPERVRGVRVSADFFRVVGVFPVLGRGFLPEEDLPGGRRVVVLSDGLWRRRFGADPGLLGRSVILGGEPYTVVGLMPRGFEFVPEADLWTTLQPVVKTTDQANYLACLGRLKPGITVGQARAEMERLAVQFRQQYPDLMGRNQSFGVFSLHEEVAGNIRPALLVLLGAVGCVLLIACANVANLLLARAATRAKEVAIRTALGASRLRLLRQLLTESAVLALAGGALGTVLGFWGLKALLVASPAGIPLVRITLDARVLGFTLAVSLLTGILFGLAPALRASRPDLNETLKEGTGRATAGSPRSRLRGLLVVSEIALALVLVVGAALLIETYLRLRNVPPGFDPRRVLTMQMSLTGPRYAHTAQVDSFFRQVLQRLETLPGVEAASSVTNLPLEQGPDLPFNIEGRTDTDNNPGAQWRAITPNYFRAMRIPLRRGRHFTDSDTGQSPAVVIVNEALVRRYWPRFPAGEDPVGQRITIGRLMGKDFGDRTREVVGVVGDIKEVGLDRAAPLTLFVPCSQVPTSFTPLLNRLLPATWVVRTAGEPLRMTTAIQREIRAVDRQQPVSNVRTLEQVLDGAVARQNFNMLLLGVFAALALVLAAVGIYGVMAYSVGQRMHEIGIRMALGAGRGAVARLIVGQGMALALAGVLVGLGGAFALTRLLAGLLFGVRPTDAATFVGVSSLLLLVALAACYLPARRAMRVDPIITLRYE